MRPHQSKGRELQEEGVKLHLDLFSGIGGFALAAKWAGYETVLFCDNDPYCQAVLRKHWPDVPIIDDVRMVNRETVADTYRKRQRQQAEWANSGELEGRTRLGLEGCNLGRGCVSVSDSQVVPTVDLVTGGFPCQPFSVAGKRGGENDDRYLWPEMLRVISLLKPTWVVAENVSGLTSIDNGLVFERVLSDLEGEGYEVQPFVIPACAVNAPHRRDRVWIVGHAEVGQDNRRERGIVACAERRWEGCNAAADTGREDVADTGQFAGGTGLCQAGQVVDGNQSRDGGAPADAEGPGLEGADTARDSCAGGCTGESGPRRREGDWWSVEPDVGRVAHGVPSRVDRLRCLGNAIVPQVAYEIIRRMEVA